MVPKVLLTRKLPPSGAEVLQIAFAQKEIELVKREEDTQAPRKWLIRELAKGDVNAVICMLGDQLDEEALEAAGPSLKVVSTMSAGYDHVEVEALRKRGVRLGTTPDALTDATADIGALLVLMASRRVGEGLRAVVDGKWPSLPWSPLLLCGHSLQRSTVGIIGFGKIGQATVKRLLAFGVRRVLYSTSTPGAPIPASKDFFGILSTPNVEIRPAKDLDELASQSDFILTCCALTSSTKGIINRDFLHKTKPTAYVVNTARGPVVDSDALVEAVENGRLAGAGLDVVTGEPNISADHPLVLNHKIVVLPHLGSATYETRNLMSLQSVENALAGLEVGSQKWANEVKFS